MLHNSLLIRDRLREANHDPLRLQRRNLHHPLIMDETASPQDDEVALTGVWSVVGQGELHGLAEARDDLCNFLTRCGMTVTDGARRRIELIVSPDGHPSGFRHTVDVDRVTVQASTSAGLWAGVVDLERTIALRRAPILPVGTIERQPQWSVQVGQAPFGANYLVPDLSDEYLSNDAFRLMAQYGLTGMTIYGDWLLYVQSDRYPELTSPEYDRNISTLRDAVQRADRFGVKLYFVPVSPKLPADHSAFQREPSLRGARIKAGLQSHGPVLHNLCSSSPESLNLHGEIFANLFQEVPNLGGLILIIGGESYYHCYMRPDKAGLPKGQETNCPRCATRSAEETVAGLLAATADAVHQVTPNVPIMAWPYSAFAWSSDPDQLGLIQQLPSGVGLLTEIDKDAWALKDGYEKHIWDYSVDFTGPSERISRQAAELQRQNCQLFVKSETALGLECIQVPYVPALQRLAMKWNNVRKLAPAGVLQSWMFFGMWGSRAEELGWWTNWRPETPLSTVLHLIAERDFGAQADAVVAAWQLMSDAAGHLPYIPTYFHGPEFIGPCHPLLFDPDESVPDIFHAALYYLQENEATFARTAKEVRHSLVMTELPEQFIGSHLRMQDGADGWAIVVNELADTAAASHAAFVLLCDASTETDTGPRTALGEELGLVEFLFRTWQSTYHTICFLQARARWSEAQQPEDRKTMLSIALDELANARSARHLFSDHPSLNLKLRVDGDYPDSLAMLEAKIALLERSLEDADSGTEPIDIGGAAADGL